MKILITAGTPRIFIKSLGINIVDDGSASAIDECGIAASLIAEGHDVTVLSSCDRAAPQGATALQYDDIDSLRHMLMYLMQNVEYDVIAHLADVPVWAQLNQTPHVYTCRSDEQHSSIEVDKATRQQFTTVTDDDVGTDVFIRLGAPAIDFIDPIVDVVHTHAAKTNATIICRRSMSQPVDKALRVQMNDVHGDMRRDSVNMTIIDTHAPINTSKVRGVKGAWVIGISGEFMPVDFERLNTMIISAASKHVAKR